MAHDASFIKKVGGRFLIFSNMFHTPIRHWK